MGILRALAGSAAAVVLVLSAPVHAEPIRLDSSLHKIPAGLHIDFLIDPAGSFTIADVANPKSGNAWFPSRETYPGFGFTGAVYWVRFTISNSTEKDLSCYIEQGYPLIQDLRLFVPKGDGTFQTIETGTRFRFKERHYHSRTFVFPLPVKAHSSLTCYMRQQTTSSMYFPITIWSPDEFKQWSIFQDRLLMFYCGMMMIMAFNYLCIYFLIRHLSYLTFSLFILSMLFFILSQRGVTFQYLTPDSPNLALIYPPLFLCLTNIIGNRFILLFLQLKRKAPVFKRIFDAEAVIIIIATLSTATIPFMDTYRIIMPATAYCSVMSIITAFAVGAYLVAKRQRNAYIYALISLGFLCGSILYVLRSFGVLPGSFITTWSIVIGSATILIVMSIAMVDRINSMRKGLTILSRKLEQDIKERSIEFLLSEIVSKITGEQKSGAPAGNSIAAFGPSIQSLLDSQRDLAIKKLSQDISIISSIGELREKTIALVKELTRARKVYLFTINEHDVLELRSFTDDIDGRRDGYSKAIVEKVFKTGSPMIITPAAGADDAADAGISPDSSILCIPIKSADRTFGICYFEKARERERFTDKDSSLMMAFAENIVGVFDNARRYRKKMLRDEGPEKSAITSVTEMKIKEAMDYIRNNYTSDISREGLAASLDISPNHLGKFFKIYTGKKISEYINELRIHDAAEKLKAAKQETIIHIAFSVGFESLSTFNRTFLKIMGLTPSEFKEKNESPQ